MSSQIQGIKRDNQKAVVGVDRSFRFVLYDYDHTTEEYIVKVITGGTGTMNVYENFDEVKGFTNVVSKWEQDIELVDNGTNGVCKTVYADTDFEIADVGRYYYLLTFTDSSNANYKPVWGLFDVVP